MTVAKAIELLSKFPGDSQFMIPDDFGDWYTPNEIFFNTCDPFDIRVYVI
jgi:hypothetical protein